MTKLTNCLLVAGIFLTSCETIYLPGGEAAPKKWSGEFTITPGRTLSYVLETTTTRSTSAGPASEIQRVKAVPIFAKAAITVGEDRSGKTEMFAEIEAPDQHLGNGSIPQGSGPQTKYMHRIGDQASFYDTEGNFIHTQTVAASPMDIDQFVNDQGRSGSFKDYKRRMEDKGAVVEDLGDGTFKIRITRAAMDGITAATRRLNDQENDPFNGAYLVSVIDTATMTTNIHGLFSASGEVLNKTYFKYVKNESGDLVLFATQSHTYQKMSDDEIVEIQTNSLYSNVIIN